MYIEGVYWWNTKIQSDVVSIPVDYIINYNNNYTTNVININGLLRLP
jgi:hypothetical protein